METRALLNYILKKGGMDLMRTFLLVIAFIVVILEAWNMRKAYEKQNLVGVVYWGFMMLMLFVALN